MNFNVFLSILIVLLDVNNQIQMMTR